ncbi:unnamed protein product [Sphagnum compactum]
MVGNGAASDGSEVGVDPPAGASPWTYNSPTKPEAGTQETTPLVHKVNIPPDSGLVHDVTGPIKEIFFYDESLRQFKNQTAGKRAFLLLKHVVPILDWLPRYNPRLFPADLIAGLTIASLAVPQDLAYAKLAGLKPVYGLYTSFVPPLIYAALGSSRHIAIGPVAVVSILLGTLLKNEISDTNDPNYLRLALTANFFAGVVQAAVGFVRLGFVIYFLSHATVVGFMAGAAITIGLQQLKGLLGIINFTTKTGIVPVLRSVFTETKQWNWQTIVIGVCFLIFLLITKQLGKRWKKLFFVSAIAPLFSVILSTVIVSQARLDKDGVAIVGHIQKGINPRSAHQIFFSGHYLASGAKIGIVAAFIALTEGIAIGRTFATLKDYRLDGNKEILSFGIMNIIGSLTSCYTATGSFSRSAVNFASGVQTALANIIMSLVVMVVLLALTPLFKYTPNCILSAIIIAAVTGLIDVKAAYHIWKVDKVDFLALLGAFFGVFFVSVEIGLLIAVCISALKIIVHVIAPHTAVLGKIPGTNIYRNVLQYPDATRIPGILLVRIDAAIYFANTNYIIERLKRYVNSEKEYSSTGPNSVPLQYVILELSPVMSVDSTAVGGLEEVLGILKRQNIQLALANPGSEVLKRLKSSGFIEHLGQEWIFLTAGEGTQVCSQLLRKNSNNSLPTDRRDTGPQS